MYLAFCIAAGIIIAVVAVAIMPYVVAILVGLVILLVSAIFGIIEAVRNYLYQFNRKLRRRL